MKHFKSLSSLLFLCLAAITMTSTTIFGQTCIPLGGSNPGSHVQNFDDLGSSPAPQAGDMLNIQVLNPSSPRVYLGKFDNAVADNNALVNIPGWALVEVGSNVSSVTDRYAAGNGSAAGSNGYSFGTDDDRAFGGLNDDTMSEIYVGGCFTNTSVGTVISVDISFTGEMWRRGANGAQIDSLDFEYAVGATDLYNGSYTPFNALNFVSPNLVGGAGSRDGNSPEYRTVFPVTLLPVNIPSGQSLYVRWVDRNIAGNDDGLAIDDFRIDFFGASSAPVMIAGRITTADGRGLPRTMITLMNMNGEMRSAISNPFGYYSFPDVTSGETYIISVFAKGHEFTSPSRVIDLTDNLFGLDFVTVPLTTAKPQNLSKTLDK